MEVHCDDIYLWGSSTIAEISETNRDSQLVRYRLVDDDIFSQGLDRIEIDIIHREGRRFEAVVEKKEEGLSCEGDAYICADWESEAGQMYFNFLEDIFETDVRTANELYLYARERFRLGDLLYLGGKGTPERFQLIFSISDLFTNGRFEAYTLTVGTDGPDDHISASLSLDLLGKRTHAKGDRSSPMIHFQFDPWAWNIDINNYLGLDSTTATKPTREPLLKYLEKRLHFK